VPRDFGLLDTAVLVIYAAVLLGIGIYYSRRQQTTEEYFVGGRGMNPIVAGISVFAAYFSVISYIATPGEYIQYGPGVMVFASLSIMPIAYVIVGWLIVPVIMRLPITSAYELLEARLGRSVRQAGSLIYIVTRLGWMAVILYTSAIILVRVIGCDPRWHYPLAIMVGAVTTTYTLIGGIRTVMVTEVLQSGMLVLGAFLTIILITVQLGGVGAWWPHHWEPHWPTQPVFSWDPHIRVTLVGAVLTALVGQICRIVVDQSAVQRLLTTRDAPAARRAYLVSMITIAVVSLTLSLVGAALLAFYRRNPPGVPGLDFNHHGDAFFPLYISHYLPTGISGLMVASLMAAAMSCLAGGINSTITVLTKDFIETAPSHHRRSDKAKLRLSRWLVLFFGVAVIVGSVGVGAVRGNLVEVANKTWNLLVCPTFGLFFLAIFIRYATSFGALIGAVYSATAAVLLAYWDMITGRPGISFTWIMPVSFAVSLAAGCLFSLVPTRGRPARVVGAYAVLALLPLAAAVTWLLRGSA